MFMFEWNIHLNYSILVYGSQFLVIKNASLTHTRNTLYTYLHLYMLYTNVIAYVCVCVHSNRRQLLVVRAALGGAWPFLCGRNALETICSIIAPCSWLSAEWQKF